MNFDVIKNIFPNHSYKVDEIIRRHGTTKAQKKLFGCFIKVINVMFDSEADLLITQKKSKEKRIAGLHNVKNKCDKIIKKQERKKKHIDGRIQEIEEESEEVIETVVMNPVIVINEQDKDRIQSLEKTLEEKEVKMAALMRENTLLSIKKHTADLLNIKRNVDHDKRTTEFGTQCDGEDEQILKNETIEMGTQSDLAETKHVHSIECDDCKRFSDRERETRFGNAQVALEVMKRLSKHNFLQPNKHETILLVKEAMETIKGSIKHKFSLFLSGKMLEMCDLMQLTFSQIQSESDRQYREVMKQLDSLK